VNIYVGNLPYSATNQDLERLFAEYGSVVSAKIVQDMQSGRSKGFGFVELDSDSAGEKAIVALNGYDLQGRSIVVNEARPKKQGGDRDRGGDRGGRGGDSGGRRWRE